MRSTEPWFLPVFPLLLVIGAWGCGLPTAVRPAAKGVWQPELGLGGPIAAVTSTLHLPLPVSTLGVRTGVTDTLDVSGHVHLTSLVFDVVGLDVGSTWLALEQNGALPAVALTGRAYGFAELRRFAPRAYLELTPAASWRVTDWFTPFVSATGLVQFAGAPPLLAAGAGAEFRFGAVGLQAEARWYGPNVASRFMVVDWYSVGGLGAWGVVLGVNYRLGGAK